MIKQEIELLQLIVGVENPVMRRGTGKEWLKWVEPAWAGNIKKFLICIDGGARIHRGVVTNNTARGVCSL